MSDTATLRALRDDAAKQLEISRQMLSAVRELVEIQNEISDPVLKNRIEDVAQTLLAANDRLITNAGQANTALLSFVRAAE